MTLRTTAAEIGRVWAAILVAYALILQAVVPAPAFVFPGGAVLCLAEGSGDGETPAGPDRHHACVLHCAPVAAALPGAAPPALPVRRSAALRAGSPGRPGRVAGAPRHRRAQPRAPPRRPR